MQQLGVCFRCFLVLLWCLKISPWFIHETNVKINHNETTGTSYQVKEEFNVYLNQTRVPAVVYALKKALLPVPSKRSWNSLGTLRTLESANSWLTFASCWTRWSRGTCIALGALLSRRSFITFVTFWARGSFRSMISGRSRGSRASWDPWNSWCAVASTLTTWPKWSLLIVKYKMY